MVGEKRVVMEKDGGSSVDSVRNREFSHGVQNECGLHSNFLLPSVGPSAWAVATITVSKAAKV